MGRRITALNTFTMKAKNKIRFRGIAAAIFRALPLSMASASDELSGFDFPGGTGPTKWQKSVQQCLQTTPVHFNGTLVEAAVSTPELSTLVQAVVAAGLVDALSAPGKRTVFAPTNDAFAAIPKEDLAVILADPGGRLTNILTYHVSAGQNIDARRGFRRPSLGTLNGQRVFLTHDYRQPPRVNNSTLSCQSVVTNNGVVWVIDSVLQPQIRND